MIFSEYNLISFRSFLPFIMYIHIAILGLIFLGIIFQGKKSISYPITRWQLAIVIIILWVSIMTLTNYDDSNDSSGEPSL